jgi:hypothetical protein
MKIEASLGDVVDRVSILQIKAKKLSDRGQLVNVKHELSVLRDAWSTTGHADMLTLAWWTGLCEVNEALWDVEDALREHEARGDFGARFVELARSVYRLNDRRAALKRQVNIALGSQVVEEKSYVSYVSEQDPTDR